MKEIHGTKLYLCRDGKVKVRSADKCKLVKSPVPECNEVSVKGREKGHLSKNKGGFPGSLPPPSFQDDAPYYNDISQPFQYDTD